MLKLEILLALFATMLKVQADPFRADNRNPAVASNAYQDWNQGSVAPRAAAGDNAQDAYQDWKQGAVAPKAVAANHAADAHKDATPAAANHVVTVTANTVAVVTATAIAPGIGNDNHPIAPPHNAHHVNHHVHHRAHPKVRHEAREEIREEAASCHVAHKHKHLHNHKHRAHPAGACHVAHKHRHEHKPKAHPAASAHKKPAAVIAHEKANTLEHIKKTHPLAAHVPAGNKMVDKLPGKGNSNHDSNDFQSFEVAQLDILRVTKLDSEHARDAHVNVVDPDVKRAIRRRTADLKGPVAREARKEATEAKVHKEVADNRHHKQPSKAGKLTRGARRVHRRADLSDSDNDVRAHTRGHRNTHPHSHHARARAHAHSHADRDSDIDHPRARAHARGARRDVDSDIDHPRAHARAHARGARRDVDSDIDHPRAHARAAHRDVDMDIDHPRARARTHAARDDRDINVHVHGDVDINRSRVPAKVDAEVDRPHIPARVVAKSGDLADKTKDTVSNVGNNVMDTVKGTGKGVGNIFSGIGKKLTGKNEKVTDAKKSEIKADIKKAELKRDLHLNPVERARLESDLKAISELDREALQYLDTSCGPVKPLEKRNNSKLSKKGKKNAVAKKNN
jgi:hypothetical protein